VCARFTTGGTNITTNGYCVFIRSDGSSTSGKIQISKKTTSTISSPFTSSNANVPGGTIPLIMLDTWYKVGIQVSGSTSVTITALINDVPLATATDTTAPVFTSGGPAVVFVGTTASFDDLRVSSP
jgi:hypothetical protein